MPGKPDESELIARIESDDPDLHMPPKKSGKQLTADQVAMLRRWVEQGAPGRRTGPSKRPRKPSLPAVKNASLAVNEIDRFILARLEAEGPVAIAPGRQDDFDPPRDARPDRPTADPHKKSTRSWPTRRTRLTRRSSTACSTRRATASTWRDSGWTPPATATPTACTSTTIARPGPTATGSSAPLTPTSRSTDSSSSNSPATCLPNATPDQIIATGYNRCHVSTNEGGSIEEEVYVRNVVDQVDTNGTVFLGLTTGCARCHDHKYDPIRAKDYYQLFAFFNNIDGPAWTAIPPSGRRSCRCRPRKQKGGTRRRSTPRSPKLKKAIAAEAAKAKAAYDIKTDAAESEAAQPSRLRLDRRCVACGGQPAGRRPLEFCRQARSSRIQRDRLVAQHRQRAQSAIFRQRRTQAQGRRRRYAVCLCLYRSSESAARADAPVAHEQAAGLIAPTGAITSSTGVPTAPRNGCGSAICLPQRSGYVWKYPSPSSN